MIHLLNITERTEKSAIYLGNMGFGLSSREKEVLVGICAGKSNKEIARDLDLQEVTIKMHVRSLAGKMGAKNRTHAAMMAREKGLV